MRLGNVKKDRFQAQKSAMLRRLILMLFSHLVVFGTLFTKLYPEEHSPVKPVEGRGRRSELVYEGMVSYGNYKVFGGAENAKLYAAGIEYDRELWPKVFHTRVDGVLEILPVVLLTQPQRTDIWGDTLTRSRKIVPGVGITPVGFRLLWRDGQRIMPYFEVKGSVIGFTQKALSSEATYENWSFHLTQGLKVKLRGKYDLRLGVLSDLHFSDAFVVRANPALDVMNVNVGVVYHLGGSPAPH
jgi:hypothetical protein